MNALKLWDNPLVIRGIRSRLRLSHAVSWGMVTVVACTFLYVLVSRNAMQSPNVTPAEASRAAIMPLLVLQGIILMVMGTGAVAGGMARERTYRLLDYQRLTPLKPGKKIVGMLFGLPIREYFMFAVSMPFVFYAAAAGGMSPIVLLKFYVVFISSAIVYHMTGLVAGMVVDKPWRAGTVSQGLIVILYFALPQISNAGFVFFEYLTARPVFYGLVMQHIVEQETLEGFISGIRYQRYESVAFFAMKVQPVVFSLAVQAFALLSLYTIVHRKWQGEWRLPFSKAYAVFFFAVAQLFLVGSVQPFMRDDRLFEMLAETTSEGMLTRSPMFAVFVVLFVTQAVSGVVAALVLHLSTAGWHQSVLAVRRVARKGRARLDWGDDAATTLPVGLACVLMTALSFIVVYQTAVSAGRIEAGNSAGEVATMLLLFAVVVITVQQVREQFSERVFVMALFTFWVVPFLTMIVVWSAFDQPILALYAAVPFPAAAFWTGTAHLVSDLQGSGSVERDLVPLIMREHTRNVVTMTLILYAGSSMLLLLAARRRWKRIYKAAGVGEPEKDEPQSVEPPLAGEPAPVYVPIEDPAVRR